MDNINIDCVGTIYMFTRDIQSCCNFEITNKMIYMASKFSKCKNHKQYLKFLLKYDNLMFNYHICILCFHTVKHVILECIH
jgi:hypothetical protein